MVVYCFGCENNSKNKPGMTFFRFPKDEIRCGLWFEVLETPRLSKYNSNYCYMNLKLCLAHFDSKDVHGNQIKKRLYIDALPISKSSLNFLDAPTTSCREVCAVKSYSKTSDDLNEALFRFPTEPDRCKCWVEACDLRDVYNNVTMSGGTMYNSSYRVCNQHFPDKMFNSPIGKIHLCPDAYPVINLEKTMASELRSVISDISQPSTSSTVDNQLDTSKGVIFQDHRYAKTESGQTNFGTQTQEKVANDNFGAKDDISHLNTSLSAPSSKSTETCQHLDNYENNGDSALHPIINCNLEDYNDCVIIEDTPPLWHFNYLPETQGFMEGIGERPRRMRWFQLRSPSVT